MLAPSEHIHNSSASSGIITTGQTRIKWHTTPLYPLIGKEKYILSKQLRSVHTTREKFENADLSLRLGLPSTLIRHENGTFRKCSSNWRNLKTPTLRFSVDGKHFENEAFRKRWRYDNHMISLLEFYTNTNAKWPVIVAFSNSSGVVWRENIWCVFRVKPLFSNSYGVVWTSPTNDKCHFIFTMENSGEWRTNVAKTFLLKPLVSG